MSKPITIVIDDNDLGQIIEGLECRMAECEATGVFHESDGNIVQGTIDLDLVDAEECRSMVGTYTRLIEILRAQWKAQQ